jgi:hypothetical protein
MLTWSYSTIKDYETCRRKFHEVKILKHYPKKETEQSLYGTNLHKQAEHFILYGTPLAPDFKFLQPIVDSLKAMPGDKLCEWKMGLKEDLTPCDFFAKDCWVRGVADLIILSPDRTTARCYDYKSGGDKYPDTDQLLLMALMIFQHFPTVQSVSGGLLFVLKGTVAKHKVKRHQAEQLWWRWRERASMIESSIQANYWPPKQNGLCKKYCEVTTCEFQGIR